jgi:DNA repair protein RadC
VITSWSQLLAYVRVALAHEPREQFRVLFLDKNYVHPMIMRSRSDASGSFVAADQ